MINDVQQQSVNEATVIGLDYLMVVDNVVHVKQTEIGIGVMDLN
jgi:hypothetical protein